MPNDRLHKNSYTPHFENVPAFFKEVFLKEKQASIWQEQIGEGTSIETFVRDHLEEYSREVSAQILERGIIDKLRLFLPELTEIKIEPVFLTRDLNVDAKVKFLEGGNEIAIENKGDGTKRRMTMALLEFKKEQSRIPNDDQTIYLLDEPDTHLHVRAQLDLVNTVEGFSSAGNQVILTTHSPFIVNAAKPSQVRLLVRHNGVSKIRSLTHEPTRSSQILRALGIENTHLFFSRRIVIVEGETEESFLPAQYLKQTGRTLSSGLIKTINVRGVHNIVGFSRAILELHDPERIYILCDNDASPELQQLIDELHIPQAHKYQVGTREFEDAFDSSVIQRVWAEYHDDCGKQVPEHWTTEKIEQVKTQCIANGEKFSTALRGLNQGGKAMKKPILGAALGERVEFDELPQQLHELLNELTNI
ncbi:MAG: AAA family ATPase [Sideroxydans sp.]|nr:AAA family ATPase [Sideroxydans sp.]